MERKKETKKQRNKETKKQRTIAKTEVHQCYSTLAG